MLYGVEILMHTTRLMMPKCLNDGSNTRINVNTGRESALDLTLVLCGNSE